MEHRITRTTQFLAVAILVIVMQSCYNDNEEDLYPQAPACDTLNVTYSASVWPVIDANCTVCHSGESPSGNLPLTNYSEISAATENGKLLGAIKHEDGWTPMPKGGGKLPDCDITRIEIWVNNGAPDN